MKPSHEELGRRLAALRATFTELGGRAAGAAGALTSTQPPPPGLIDELTQARAAFAALRGAVLEQAGALAVVVDDDRVGSLSALAPVLQAITQAEARRVQRQAWDEARAKAIVLLERVARLIHVEERQFTPLVECQATARELHQFFAGPPPEDLEREIAHVSARTAPYVDLLALVDGWNVLADDRCARLQDAIADSLGRPLALAAVRGKLGREGQAPPARIERAPEAPISAEPSTVSFAAAVAHPPAPEARTVAAAAAAGTPPFVAAPPPAPAAAAPRRAPLPPPDMGPTSSIVHIANSATLEDARFSGESVEVETPEARKAREAELETLAADTAPWWLAARTGWHAMQGAGRSIGEATREQLGRFPYLLSVPIQKSAEYEDGRLAEGYALLLQHVERQERGFVNDALSRLNPGFMAGADPRSFPLGQELYLYVVAEGRLYKTYPDFVRDVLGHVVPSPGLWVQGGIEESEAQTLVFTRAAEPGTAARQETPFTRPDERGRAHTFTVTTGPLTTRVFTLQGQGLGEPREVEIKLKENDAPSDHAWLLTVPAGDDKRAAPPRKHRVGGTTLPDFGKEFSALWIAVYNADPNNDKSYELSVRLPRKATAGQRLGARASEPAPPSPSSTFFGKRR